MMTNLYLTLAFLILVVLAGLIRSWGGRVVAAVVITAGLAVYPLVIGGCSAIRSAAESCAGLPAASAGVTALEAACGKGQPCDPLAAAAAIAARLLLDRAEAACEAGDDAVPVLAALERALAVDLDEPPPPPTSRGANMAARRGGDVPQEFRDGLAELYIAESETTLRVLTPYLPGIAWRLTGADLAFEEDASADVVLDALKARAREIILSQVAREMLGDRLIVAGSCRWQGRVKKYPTVYGRAGAVLRVLMATPEGQRLQAGLC